MFQLVKPAVFLCVTVALASCQSGTPQPSASRSGFKANYMVARAALEGGQYTKASRSYRALLKKAGPFEPRIRLEYAHALLRAGKFEDASAEARIVAASLQGKGRAAALAVQGTADHELARQTIARGSVTSDAIQRLVAAREAFDELLSAHPVLDPLGGMALRREAIEVELSTIR